MAGFRRFYELCLYIEYGNGYRRRARITVGSYETAEWLAGIIAEALGPKAKVSYNVARAGEML